MNRYFNTSGPCSPDTHYFLPSEARCKGIMDLIGQGQYFVIHAARQSGKTTLLMELAKKLNDSGKFFALYCSLEAIQNIQDPEKGIPAIIKTLKQEFELEEFSNNYQFAKNPDYSDYTNIIEKELRLFCKKLSKPLVILFDEIDCLKNGTLITFLRQIRKGYINRIRHPFVHSIGLIGMRNIRDYKAKIRDDSDSLGSASPFNIVKRSMTLKNFTKQDIKELYDQHTKQTGQKFLPDTIDEVYYYTKGQPWLVNAIACEIVEEILENDYLKPIEKDLVPKASYNIIARRDTHIDSLMERLKEKRVQKVIEPLILGESKGYDILDDDYQYTLDLGIVCLSDKKRLEPSNPIYAEIIIRYLSFKSQSKMNDLDYPKTVPAYIEDNKIDMEKLLKDFQQFWRENSDIWQQDYQYKEAAPHLILQAFLQRVINSGGSIIREFGAGRGRLDLCVKYLGNSYPVELKLRYGQSSYKEGIEQILGYMDYLGCKQGWLIVFDRRKTVLWEDKIFWETHTADGKTVNIIGC